MRWLDPERADREWDENSDPSKQRGAPAAEDPAEESLALNVDPSVPETLSYAAARARREAANAEIAELKLAELQGRLVAADVVKRQAFETARAVREAILGIPDRLAAQLAGDSDPDSVHALLTEDLRHALGELANVGNAPEA